MDFESLLTATKWEILQEIAHTPSSPLQLAEKIGTTIANISIQLRLLEAAGIVTKTKTGKVKAGKPRSLYTVKQEMTHITTLANGLAFKQLIPINRQQKTQLAIWQVSQNIQLPMLKFFIDHEELQECDVYLTGYDNNNIRCTTKTTNRKKQDNFNIATHQGTYQLHLSYNKDYQPLPEDTQICFGGTQQ